MLGGWDGTANFKIEFKSGGAIEFAEKLKQTATQGKYRSVHTFRVLFLSATFNATLNKEILECRVNYY